MRDELASIERFVREGPTWERAMDVFWTLYRPPQGDLLRGVDLLEAIQRLENIEPALRPRYVPDTPPDREDQFVYLHISTALAIAYRRYDEGYSDRFRGQLNASWRAAGGPELQSLKFTYLEDDEGKKPIMPATERDASLFALAGILALEQSLICLSDGAPEDALSHLRQGCELSIIAFRWAVRQYLPGPDSVRASGSLLPPQLIDVLDHLGQFYSSPGWGGLVSWNATGVRCVPFTGDWPEPYLLQHLVDIVGAIADNDREETKWTSVESQVDRVLALLDPPSASDPVFWEDSEGSVEAWSWWARKLCKERDKTSRSQLHRLMRKGQEYDAEQRIKTYCFGEDLWKALPSETRRALIEADRRMFAQGGGRYESVANELRLATEALLIDLFWERFERLSELHGARSLAVGFANLRKRMKEEIDRPDAVPSLAHLRQMLTTDWFSEWLHHTGISKNDIDWLTAKGLPRAIRDLQEARRAAEHPRLSGASHEGAVKGQRVDADTIRELFRRFLGFGQEGILPRLARIGQQYRLLQTTH